MSVSQARMAMAAPRPARRTRTPRIVALGGGTGLPTLLRGLRMELRPRSPGEGPTAIVTVADDGGSSGRLREAFSVAPPGDIRNCLLALSDGDPTLAAIFNFRFGGTDGVSGHSLGNLILTALCELEQGFAGAVEESARMLSVRGRVLPATLDSVRLVAELEDGRRVAGESRIAEAGRPVRRVVLEPSPARACPRACQALAEADLVVLGPGSLYTSLIPILLIPGIARALARTTAPCVLVMNLMTEPGETTGFTAADHVRAVRAHAPDVPLSAVLVNSAPLAAGPVARYATAGATPVEPDPRCLRQMGIRVIERDLLAAGPSLRHDPTKLARSVLELARVTSHSETAP